jgi:hypothetical protein
VPAGKANRNAGIRARSWSLAVSVARCVRSSRCRVWSGRSDRARGPDRPPTIALILAPFTSTADAADAAGHARHRVHDTAGSPESTGALPLPTPCRSPRCGGAARRCAVRGASVQPVSFFGQAGLTGQCSHRPLLVGYRGVCRVRAMFRSVHYLSATGVPAACGWCVRTVHYLSVTGCPCRVRAVCSHRPPPVGYRGACRVRPALSHRLPPTATPRLPPNATRRRAGPADSESARSRRSSVAGPGRSRRSGGARDRVQAR